MSPTRTDRFAQTLPAVHADAANVLRSTVGLRPYRPDGFVIRSEQLGAKMLIHDYGHGGSGISLSFGTAQMSLDLLGDRQIDSAAVIGCGIVGLATARLLQRRGVRVTIYTSRQTPDTTSDRSGAFWAPFGLVDADRLTPAITADIVKAGRIAYAEFEHMAGADRYAVRRMPAYYLDDRTPEVTDEEKLFPDLFHGSPLGPGHHPFGDRFALIVHAFAIEPTPLTRAIQQDVTADGGTIVVREIRSRGDIASLPEPVVFNCTGLGARELANDDTLIPMRGQLTLLRAQPEVQYMLAVPRKRLYMIPRSDGVVLGTSLNRNNWSLDPDPAETRRVVEGIRALRA